MELLPLVPLDDATAVVPGPGVDEGGTARIIAAGNQEMLRYSGFELRLSQNKR